MTGDESTAPGRLARGLPLAGARRYGASLSARAGCPDERAPGKHERILNFGPTGA
jgi:hypothetical protein